ncbi:IS30 family transposase [bacterium]|nr:IS30 family transposase [bacterium]
MINCAKAQRALVEKAFCSRKNTDLLLGHHRDGIMRRAPLTCLLKTALIGLSRNNAFEWNNALAPLTGLSAALQRKLWIYYYIYADKRHGGDLHTHLRCQKQRRKRYGSIQRCGQIKNRVSIEKRPKIVDLRSRVGDWEADTGIGKQGHSVLVTLVEQKTRFTIVTKATNKTARSVIDAICDYLKPYRDRVLTMTYDNGREFDYHVEIARELTAEGFFAHPYHSWERDLNENTNGLFRQYVPKEKDVHDLNDQQVAKIMKKIIISPENALASRSQIS